MQSVKRSRPQLPKIDASLYVCPDCLTMASLHKEASNGLSRNRSKVSSGTVDSIAEWRLEFLQLQQLWPLGGLAPLIKRHKCHESGLSLGRQTMQIYSN
jgi:hypothetical protein